VSSQCCWPGLSDRERYALAGSPRRRGGERNYHDEGIESKAAILGVGRECLGTHFSAAVSSSVLSCNASVCVDMQLELGSGVFSSLCSVSSLCFVFVSVVTRPGMHRDLQLAR